MLYNDTVKLKNGSDLLLRSGDVDDAAAVLEIFIRTHTETDFLLSYPDEITFTVEKEAAFLKEKAEDPRSVELLAFLGGKLVGSAGFDAVKKVFKLNHRAEFGISVLKEHWGIGIGSALTAACIDCARRAGYTQLELDVLSVNAAAVALYKKHGFVEFGRNPRGFRLRNGEYRELINMRREL